MLISEAYRDLNARLHAEEPFYGTSSKLWAGYVDKLAREELYGSILDYGCGKGILARELSPRGFNVSEYDPAIPGKDQKPDPAELVVCTDVLEHIEPDKINAVLRDLKRVTQCKLFFNIATRESKKTLADGRNAHLLVRDKNWWADKLGKFFYIVVWEVRPDHIYGEALPITDEIKKLSEGRKRQGKNFQAKRRPLTPEWARQFEEIKAQNNKYSDASSKIETIRMWEGVEDEQADMHVACNILEHLTYPEVDEALAEMARLSRVAVMITAKLDPVRNHSYWRRVFEKRYRIASDHILNDHVMLVGAPMVGVQGVTATGAVGAVDRWKNIEAATKRFKTRIDVKPAHHKRALIACYGPSLKDNIAQLKMHAFEPHVTVISVSGAHDFLIENGIIPHYHVECDPRAHKADNINAGHRAVEYLLASVCHPVLFDKLEGFPVKLWHVSAQEHTIPLIDKLGEIGDHVISGGGSVGLRSIPLLYAMGYREFSIFGMDCSFKVEGEDVQQWAGKHAGKRQEVCQVDCNGRAFAASPILMTYATGFFEQLQKMDDCSFRLYGDGLLQDMSRYYMGQTDFMQRVEMPVSEAA